MAGNLIISSLIIAALPLGEHLQTSPAPLEPQKQGSTASFAQPDGGLFAGCGTLERGPQGCLVIFVADSGRSFTLDDIGGFWWGDRVYVTGTINLQSVACFPWMNIPAIEDNTIAECFAGCGVLERGPQSCIVVFVADSGRSFTLENLGDFWWGDRVYITGVINEESMACFPVNMPAIEKNTIGACFDGCGVLGRGPQNCFVIFVADAGRSYVLDNLGPFWWGDRVHVTGGINEDSLACWPAVMPAIEHNLINVCRLRPGTRNAVSIPASARTGQAVTVGD